jgi:hypothetical protein
MTQLVENIINKDFDEANKTLEENFKTILEKKMCEMKKIYAAKMSEQNTHSERQKRLRMGVLEEDDIEEGLLKVAKDKLKLMSPTARANMRRMEEESLDEQKEELDEARVNIVKLRVRGGKIQRRKKVSNVPGMTFRSGKLERMSASERRRRKLGAKKGARKSKMKKTQMLRKRRMSLMKRQRLGG